MANSALDQPKGRRNSKGASNRQHEFVLDRAEITHTHDEWTKEKFTTGKYKSSDLYGSPRIPELKKEYEEYLEKAPTRKPAAKKQ